MDPSSAIAKMVDTAWAIAYTALWNGIILSEQEKALSMKIIERFLLRSQSPQKSFSEFSQRILLAHYHYNHHPVLNMPLPTQWLDEDNNTVFTRSKEWFDSICEARTANPLFKTELRLFSRAILEIYNDPCGKNFHAWSEYFQINKRPQLFKLFLWTVINSQNPW